MADWLNGNYIEVLGVLLSVVYLWLSIRQNILLWPVGILSALIYIIVFYDSKFYADMGLNAYYFVISIYGWIHWSKRSTEKNAGLPVLNVGLVRGAVLLVIILILFVVTGYLLDHLTDSPVPYWDALTTAASIVATWMLTRKILEHWILWVFIDVVSMGLYIYKGLYPTAILFAIYTTMAVIGYLQWKRSKKMEEQCPE
jgi:nicotinamide mononucleotide transporter